jgi:hypothetical protein
MGRKMVGLMLVAVTFVVLLVAGPLPVHAASALVQQNNAGCVSCASATLAVSFTSNVASGNVLVVGVFLSVSGIGVNSIHDSFGSLNQAVASTTGSESVQIFTAALASSGPDTVTATFPVQNFENLYIYEVSGVTTTGSTGHDTSTGSTSIDAAVGCPCSFEPGAFLLGIIGTQLGTSPPTVTPGTGFTLSPDNSATGASHAQYSTSGVFSPTIFPATTNHPTTRWVEAGLVLFPSQTVGGEVAPINVAGVVAPWIALMITITVGLVAAGMFARRLVTKHK